MNEISVAIKISKHSFSSDILTSKLDLIPTHSHSIGESYSMKTANGLVEKKYDDNYWEYRQEFKTNEWVQTLIDKFIEDVVLLRKEVLKDLSAQCAIEFFVGVNYYKEGNPGFHFNLHEIAILSYIGAELDIDLYCFNDDV